MALAPNARILAVGRKDRRIELIDANTALIQQTLVGHLGRIEMMTFTPDGKTLLALDDRGILKVWQVAHGNRGVLPTGPEMLTWPSREPIKSFNLSPDGNWLTLVRAKDAEIIEIAPIDHVP